MNTDKRTEFDEETLVAFLLGIGEAAANEKIREALEWDEELRVQIGFLAAMLPSASEISNWPASLQQSHDDTQAIEIESDETHATAAAPELDPDATQSEDGEIDELIAGLDRQGLSPGQISERIGVTRTLVELKLRRIRKNRKHGGG